MEKHRSIQTSKKKQLRIKKKWQLSRINIDKKLRDILHGYIMSDGYIRQGILQIRQSKKQKLFVLWLYDKFQSIRTPSDIKKRIQKHSKTQTKHSSLFFSTQAVLHGFHHMWYRPFVDEKGVLRYKKTLPKTIPCFFNETFISVWFAGDGTKILGSLGAKFEVTSFSVEERLKLKQLFLTKYDIKTQIILSGKSKKGTSQWALKIPASEYSKFRDLITTNDLIPKVFPYKLHKKR